MKKAKKREKPIFVKNVVARRKVLGWNAHELAEAARIPYPTLRDIEAGINAGREDTKLAIAKALNASLGELYSEATTTQMRPPEQPLSPKTIERLIEAPGEASLADAQQLFQKLGATSEARRALLLALLIGDYEIARPYMPEDAPGLRSLLKAL